MDDENVLSYSRRSPCAGEREELSPGAAAQYDRRNLVRIGVVPPEGGSDNLRLFCIKQIRDANGSEHGLTM
jgi:hypothetical protein